MRHIYVVCSAGYVHKPLIAFSDYDEAAEFAKQMPNSWLNDLFEVQLAEGGLFDEMYRELGRKLDSEGIENVGVEFEARQ